MMVRILALATCLVAACPPAPKPPPTPDASDAATLTDAPAQTPCEAACSALTSLGCAQGSQPDCVTVFAHADGDRLMRTPNGTPLTCAAVAQVKSVAELAALGLPCPK
jgi:hypothetical protein